MGTRACDAHASARKGLGCGCRPAPQPIHFGVQDSRFRVQGLRFRICVSGTVIQGLGFRLRGSGFGVQCLWSGVQNSRFTVQGRSKNSQKAKASRILPFIYENHSLGTFFRVWRSTAFFKFNLGLQASCPGFEVQGSVSGIQGLGFMV